MPTYTDTSPIQGLEKTLNVAVLVDLLWEAGAGGHVKVWERFAQAAQAFNNLDLTIYFLGDREQEISLASNVRYRLLPAAFSTQRIPFLRRLTNHTDLARYHPRLATYLPNHDILHVTSSFAFAKTAQRLAKQHQKPLVVSLHTDVPKLTRVYTTEVIETLLRPNIWGYRLWRHLLLKVLRVQNWSAQDAQRQQNRLLKACDRVLVSSLTDQQKCQALMPRDRIHYLRRGIDKQLFSPAKRDRLWLQQTYDISPSLPVALFVGRVDETKRVMTLARAARLLLDQGERLHVMVAGQGSQMAEVQALLGQQVTLTGSLPPEQLAQVMASADIFVFLSESEMASNVTLEARASGLPVVLSAYSSTTQYLKASHYDGFTLTTTTPEALADLLQPLLRDNHHRQEVGLNARHQIEAHWPTWEAVVAEDLLPVWQLVHPQVATLYSQA